MCASAAVGRKPWVAVSLSLVSTGLGHVYCGRIVKGLALFGASLLFAPLAAAAALLPPSTPVLAVLVLGCAAVVVLYLYAAADAYLLARACRDHYEPRDYNRGAVYLLLGVAGVAYPAGAAAYLRAHVFEAFLVPSRSMVPTVLDGDRVLANKAARPARLPERGEVVVFHVPREPGKTWIKRVVGLPGDRVAVRGGQVFVNGSPLQRDRVPAAHLAAVGAQATGAVYVEANAGRRYLVMLGGGDGKGPDFAEQTVPEGSYFMLGDNRDQARDSRSFGFVPRGELIGAVQYVYWPAESWERFGPLRE